jgi:hypothetical protein
MPAPLRVNYVVRFLLLASTPVNQAFHLRAQ